MGVERAVTRWYILRQPLLDEIAALEVRLAELEQQAHKPQSDADQIPVDHALIDKVVQQLQTLQTRLTALGPCPKPMMG